MHRTDSTIRKIQIKHFSGPQSFDDDVMLTIMILFPDFCCFRRQT